LTTLREERISRKKHLNDNHNIIYIGQVLSLHSNQAGENWIASGMSTTMP